MSNTITAYFKGRVGVAESVYQNDYGMVMNFDSIDLPAHFDCYFSILNQEEAIPGVGADGMVAIPNSVLANPGAVTIHIPIHTGANDSEVEYVVYFKVIGRARPIDDGTPDEMTAIAKALALLQNPITNIEQIVNEALAFTGDTFDEMQEQLDADQSAFETEMGTRADTFESGIRARQTQVESDFSNLNAQFQTAVGALTVDDELLNVRVGDDNVTYATAGDAVRKQFAAVKSDIASLVTDGTYIVDLTWEHGGIDNATGQNNNEGSTTRSRVAEYMKCSDYDYISSTDESQNVWVIYYNSNKVFIGSDSVVNGTAEIQQNYTFFRLDYRRGLEYTYNIKLYKYAESEKRITALEADAVTYDAVSDLFISTPDLEWEQGTLADASGIKGASTVRIRTVDFLKIQAKSTLSLTTNDSYIFQVYFWDENLIYQGATSNLSSYSNQFENDTYVKVVLKNTNIELDILPAEGSNLNATLIGLRDESDESDDETSYPSYWENAIADAEASINNALASDEHSSSFAFVTDTHVGSNRGYSGALMKKVMADCHIPVWFHGGDAVTGSAVISKENLIAEMNADFEHFKAIENIGLRAIGNHEPAFGTSNYNYNLTNGEINQFYHGVDREKYLQIYGNQKGYFYKDIHKDKLRCIMLDIVPYESQVDSSGLVTGSNKMWYHQFGSEQLEWFADVLANTPNGYSVVVCSHIAPVSLAELKTLDNSWSESVPIDYMQARKIAEAFALKSTYSFNGGISGDTTGDSYSIDVDYANASGTFVCWFCGHTHKDFNLTLDNVLIVGTANDSIAVSANVSSYAPSKTLGTVTEQIMDFFCILPSARKVKVVRLGAYLEANGKVRTFTY